MYFIWRCTEVQQNHPQFAAVAGIDSRRSIRKRDRMLQSESAARPNLHFVTRGNFERQTGCYCLSDAWNKHCIFQAADIEARIFGRSVRILRKACVAMKFLDSDSHVESAIIAAACPHPCPCRIPLPNVY